MPGRMVVKNWPSYAQHCKYEYPCLPPASLFLLRKIHICLWGYFTCLPASADSHRRLRFSNFPYWLTGYAVGATFIKI